MSSVPRKKIPAAVQREVRTRSGHHCSVCGDSGPHEIAHIVEHARTRDNTAPNLLLLCVKCHTRSHLETPHWGRITLEWYRDHPWVLRREKADASPGADAACSLPENLPYPPLGHHLFVGRDADLGHIHNAFHSPGEPAGSSKGDPLPRAFAMLHGLGGMGKTRVACEYAWLHREEYDACLFLDATTADTLHRSLVGLASVLPGLPSESSDEQRHATVLAWLRNQPKLLLILDNIDDDPAADAAISLVRYVPRGHFLLTGRPGRSFENVVPLHLTDLLPEDAAGFLLRRTARRTATADEESRAHRLADALTGLPLLLEQAAAYINDRQLTLADYCRHWDAKRQQCLAAWDPRESHYVGGDRRRGSSVMATWLTSIELLTPAARLLLDICAHCSYEPIPAWVLEDPETIKVWPQWLGTHEIVPAAAPPVQEQAPDEALRALVQAGLVTRTHTGPPGAPYSRAFVLHRILQDVTRQHQEQENRADMLRLCATQWMAGLFYGDVHEVARWSQFDPLAPHARLLAEQVAGTTGPDDANHPRSSFSHEQQSAGRILCNLSSWGYSHGDFRLAERWSRHAIQLLLQTSGPEHPDTLAARHNLARALDDLGRDREAAEEHRAVLALRERVLGPEHPDTLRSRNDLANSLRAQGMFAASETEHRAVLVIRERLLGPEHPMTLYSRHNLATALRDKGDYQEAEKEDRDILGIRERTIGPDHPDTLKSRHNLAITLLSQNRPGEAEKQIRLVIEARARTIGAEHPDTLKARANLAVALMEKPDGLGDAEAEISAVLAIEQRVLGEDHPTTLGSRRILYQIHEKAGKLKEAEAELHSVLDAQQRVLGHLHPDTLGSTVDLADIVRKQGRHKEADALLDGVMPILKKTLGTDHPLTRSATRLAAQVTMFRGMSDEAKLEKQIQALEAEFDPENSLVLHLRTGLATAKMRQLCFLAGEKEYRKVYEARLKHDGAEHPDTIESSLDLVTCLWLLHRDPHVRDDPARARIYFDEAGKLVKQAADNITADRPDLWRRLVECQELLRGPGHPDTLAFRFKFAMALYKQGNLAEAEVEFRKLLDLQEALLGGDHQETLVSRQLIVLTLSSQGKHVEAEAELRTILAVQERVFGPEEADTLQTREFIAVSLGAQGKQVEAEAEFRAIHTVQKRHLGGAHPDALKTEFNIVQTIQNQGRFAHAEALYRALIDSMEHVLAPGDQSIWMCRFSLSQCLRTLGEEQWKLGEGNRARELWQESLAIAQSVLDAASRVFGPEHPYMKASLEMVRDLVEDFE